MPSLMGAAVIGSRVLSSTRAQGCSVLTARVTEQAINSAANEHRLCVEITGLPNLYSQHRFCLSETCLVISSKFQISRNNSAGSTVNRRDLSMHNHSDNVLLARRGKLSKTLVWLGAQDWTNLTYRWHTSSAKV